MVLDKMRNPKKFRGSSLHKDQRKAFPAFSPSRPRLFCQLGKVSWRTDSWQTKVIFLKKLYSFR